MYAAVGPDSKWHRVLALSFNTKTVKVFYLDYGTIGEVHVTCLLSLEGKFLTIPFQAICCSLVSLPLSDTWKSWNIKVVNYFRELVMNEENILCSVSDVVDQVLHVDLILPSGESVANLVETFMTDFQMSQVELSPSLPTSDGFDSSSLCDMSDCEMQKWCQCSVPVQVMHISSPSDFYVQSAEAACKEKLSWLADQLNEICETSSSKFVPNVGMVVGARDEDGTWYRAKILSVNSDRKSLVHFVDFGHFRIISQEHMRLIPAATVSMLPKQAVHCCIDRIIGCGEKGEWSERAIEWFTRTCLQKNFSFKYVYKRQPDVLKWNVDLIDCSTYQSIRQMLLAEQLATTSASVADSKPHELKTQHFNDNHLNDSTKQNFHFYFKELPLGSLPSKSAVRVTKVMEITEFCCYQAEVGE